MGHRLSKIYTRTGDDGTTGLGDGNRIAKSSARLHALGEIDELNCHLGLLINEDLPIDLGAVLLDIQHDLFDLGGELSIPESEFVNEAAVIKIEAAIDRYNEALPPLKEFILPGGNRAAAICHLARAVCRRAERSLQVLADDAALNPQALKFVNRLSDLLFVAARVIARDSGAGEVLWQRDRS